MILLALTIQTSVMIMIVRTLILIDCSDEAIRALDAKENSQK